MAVLTMALMVALVGYGFAAASDASPPTGAAPSPAPTTGAAPSPAPMTGAGLNLEPLHLSLLQALDLAVKNSPTLLSELSNIRVAALDIEKSRIPLRFTASVSSLYSRDLHPTVLSQQTNLQYGLNVYNNTLTLQQTIYTFERVQWDVLAARLAEKQAEQDYRSSVESLLQQIQIQYIAVQLDDLNVHINQTELDLRRDFLKTAMNLYDSGQVAQYDILNYKQSVQQTEQSLLSALTSRDQAATALLISLNLPPRRPLIVEPLADRQLEPPPTVADSIDMALTRRPEVLSEEWAVSSAEATVRSAALTNAPSLGVNMTYGMENTLIPANDQWTVGLTLSLPIIDGGAAHVNKLLAREAVEQARQQLEVIRRSVISDVVTATEQLESLWAQEKKALDFIATTLQALDIAGLRYKEGISNSVELLNAQIAYTTAQSTEAQVFSSYRIAVINWQRAVSADYPIKLPDYLKVKRDKPTHGGSDARHAIPDDDRSRPPHPRDEAGAKGN